MAPQPLFHKNFNLLAQTLEDYQLQGYTLYKLADSQKQQERLKDIFGFGGGYSMISLIQGQVVTQYHWMTMQTVYYIRCGT